jgi:hypothetical protein
MLSLLLLKNLVVVKSLYDSSIETLPSASVYNQLKGKEKLVH